MTGLFVFYAPLGTQQPVFGSAVFLLGCGTVCLHATPSARWRHPHGASPPRRPLHPRHRHHWRERGGRTFGSWGDIGASLGTNHVARMRRPSDKTPSMPSRGQHNALGPSVSKNGRRRQASRRRDRQSGPRPTLRAKKMSGEDLSAPKRQNAGTLADAGVFQAESKAGLHPRQIRTCGEHQPRRRTGLHRCSSCRSPCC